MFLLQRRRWLRVPFAARGLVSFLSFLLVSEIGLSDKAPDTKFHRATTSMPFVRYGTASSQPKNAAQATHCLPRFFALNRQSKARLSPSASSAAVGTARLGCNGGDDHCGGKYGRSFFDRFKVESFPPAGQVGTVRGLLFASGLSLSDALSWDQPVPPVEEKRDLGNIPVANRLSRAMGDGSASGMAEGRQQSKRLLNDGHGGEGIVRLPPSGTHSNTIIFLHGLGDTASGWEELAEQLHKMKQFGNTKIILPTAPIRPVKISMGFPQNAWANIYGLTENDAEDEAGYRDSVARMRRIIDGEIHKNKIAPQNIVVGGFSQGAALAYLVGLSPFRISEVDAQEIVRKGDLVSYPSDKEPQVCIEEGDTHTVGAASCPASALGGIVALSGWVPMAKYKDISPVVRNSTLSILHAHGTLDSIVDFKWGEMSARLTSEALGEATASASEELKRRRHRAYTERVRFVPMNGLDHEASGETFDEVKRFLTDVLSGNSNGVPES